MFRKSFLLLLLLVPLCFLGALNPPRDLTAAGGNGYVDLAWIAPLPDNLVELYYHDNTPYSGFYQYQQQAYGTVFDLSSYSGATAFQVDFRHSTFSYPVYTQYRIHLIDWSSRTTLWVSDTLSTTTLDGWELSIPVSGVTASLLGVFIEPLSGTLTDAYPVVDFDSDLSSNSCVISLPSNDPVTAQGDYGDFLINFWIQTVSREVALAPHYELARNPQSNIPWTAQARPAQPQPTDNPRDFIGYNVYRDNLLLTTSPISTLSYHDTNVVNNTTYSYGVSAVYDDGESDRVTASATPHVPATIDWIEGFESNGSNIPEGWSRIDADGDGYQWQIQSTNNSVSPFEGTYCAVSYSYDNDTMMPLTPDNYLITKKFQVPADSCWFAFYIRTQDQNYPMEHLSVKLSISGNETGDFTYLLDDFNLHAGDWYRDNISLNDFRGDSVYVAFEHCQSTDQFALKIDNVCVYISPVGTGDQTQPGLTPLLTVAPNPFNPSTTISYNVPQTARVSVKIYNLKGQLVKTLVNAEKTPGDYQIRWDGTDANNRTTASGVYFVRLDSGHGFTATRKMVMMK